MAETAIANKNAETKTVPDGRFQNTKLRKEPYTKRAAAMLQEAQKYTATWKELKTYNYPTKGFFHTATPNQGSKIDHTTLLDEEATLDIDTFASGMMNGFTSPSRPWFKLFLEDKALMGLDTVKIWLDAAQEKMYSIFSVSNTYKVLTSMFTELPAFGTACCYVDDDFETVIRLHDYTIGEYALSRDKNGKVNGFYHKFWMTIGQAVEEFGEGNLSPTNRASYRNNNSDNWIVINHLIEANNDRVPFLKDFMNMPFRSLYWEDNTGDFNWLRIGGFEEFPILAPRFEVTTEADIYGKGPGWKSLGANKELQKKKRNLLIALDKKTNPPLQKDSSVQGDVNTMPGGITTVSSLTPNAGVRTTYQVDLDINALEISIEKTKRIIQKFYFTDLFQMLLNAEREGKPKTATEIVELISERAAKIGPLLERWQGDEFIAALIDRTFNIALRKNVFPPIPQELVGIEIKIRYTSVLAQAQRMIEIAAIDAWAVGVMEEHGINQNSIDIINFDEKNRAKAEAMGVPEKIVNSLAEMSKIRQAKAEAQRQVENSQRMMAMAKGAKDGAKAVKDMSDADMSGDSALNRTLGAFADVQGNQ